MNRIEPELVKVIEEIVARRLKEELEQRAKLVTIDHFTEAMSRIDRRFEAMQTEMDRRFTEMNRRFDSVEKIVVNNARRFDSVEKIVVSNARRFDSVEKIVVSNAHILNNLQSQLGTSFEQFARNMVSRILGGEGISNVILTSRHFHDAAGIFFSQKEDIEIDGLSEKPPIIIEVTAILRDEQKVNMFLKKKQFIESFFKQKFRGFFVATGTELSQMQLADVTVLLRKNGCELLNL